MAQNYKVYFANRPVFFTHVSNTEIPTGPGISMFKSQGKLDTLFMEHEISQGAKAIYVQCDDVEISWQNFLEQFEQIPAAGGLVVNHKNEVLFIFRLEKWDLPKGKVELGEEIVEGAIREVEEECSITGLEVKKHLCNTWHTYIQNGQPILKCTSWYLMSYDGNEKPKPQAIEGITEVRWIAENDWNIVRSNTYPSVLDVLDEFKKVDSSM